MFIHNSNHLHDQVKLHNAAIAISKKRTHSEILHTSVRVQKRSKTLHRFAKQKNGSLVKALLGQKLHINTNKKTPTIVCTHKVPADILLDTCSSTHQTQITVDLYDTWRKLFQPHNLVNNIVFHDTKHDKQYVTDVSGKFQFSKNVSIDAITVQSQPRICANLVTSADLFKYKHEPQTRIFVLRKTINVYLMLLFRVTVGFQCLKCGHTTPLLRNAAKHVFCAPKYFDDFGEVVFTQNNTWTVNRNFEHPIVRAAQSSSYNNFKFTARQFDAAFARNTYKRQIKV